MPGYSNENWEAAQETKSAIAAALDALCEIRDALRDAQGREDARCVVAAVVARLGQESQSQLDELEWKHAMQHGANLLRLAREAVKAGQE